MFGSFDFYYQKDLYHRSIHGRPRKHAIRAWICDKSDDTKATQIFWLPPSSRRHLLTSCNASGADGTRVGCRDRGARHTEGRGAGRCISDRARSLDRPASPAPRGSPTPRRPAICSAPATLSEPAPPLPRSGPGMATADEESVYSLARVFFNAATKQSDDSEDILPQEVWAPPPPVLAFLG